jgi:hypothetical protein
MRLPVVVAAFAGLASLGLGIATGPASSQPLPMPFQGQSILGGRPNTPPAAWCANDRSDWDRVEPDCSFPTFAACQRALVNPNSGYCTQTSFYADAPPPPPRRKKKARR